MSVRTDHRCQYPAVGAVEITPQDSFRIDKITLQSKGGDGGRPSAIMLQFKINAALLI